MFFGTVGDFFNQVIGDSGPGATLASFQSRVVGIGPQVGYLVPIGGTQGFSHRRRPISTPTKATAVSVPKSAGLELVRIA
jgi:hypothetical protein